MEQAIKKAVEGGWELPPKGSVAEKVIELFAFSDPTFWQAFGKTMGWKETCFDCGEEVTRTPTPEYPRLNGLSCCPHHCEAKNFMDGWLYEWHLFIDHVAQGKDADSFFTNLLK